MPSTPLRVVLEPTSEYELLADYFEGQIDLKAFRAHVRHYRVLSANPLVLEAEKGSYIYIERFGGLVFWNCTEPVIQTLHQELQELLSSGERIDRVRDRLEVHLGGDADHVGFSEVWLKELTLEKLKIVSLALAQSVALDYFEGSVKDAMARFQPVMRGLSQHGKLFLNHHETLKSIGFAMEVRAAVLDNLTLFDSPPETWESESLAHLDSALFDQFDLQERYGAIQQKLVYLSDAGARIMDVLTTRRNHQLEWIVIILIGIEVISFLWR